MARWAWHSSRARPDGYTVAIAPNGTYAMATALYDRLPYDIERGFAPVGLLATTPIFVCIHPNAPWRSLAELVAAAKAQPTSITYASAGAGSTSHLFVELLLDMIGMQRGAQTPEVPTVSESGFPGYRALVDFGLFAPAGTPQPILDRLVSEARIAMKLPGLQLRLESPAMEAVGGTPAEFATS
ncbi:Tripartite-type tricarboxylate transporter, receptor component TctC [Belnapia rosea]|uniref:Tripartite-type tricarboxylate transporter, receptor component TctC n=1 Tax=Belnapia rosea TaxID=938405 RepID=A0A1G6UH70_9PROT|nr:Tripartite-type tricarboxylate transporter, receptor component TctC [Belnapia rosea]